MASLPPERFTGHKDSLESTRVCVSVSKAFADRMSIVTELQGGSVDFFVPREQYPNTISYLSSTSDVPATTRLL
jgi:hypothetical protein